MITQHPKAALGRLKQMLKFYTGNLIQNQEERMQLLRDRDYCKA